MGTNNSKLKNPEDILVPDEVKVAAIEGRLTFFIGNGLSRLYGIPSWDELANRMLKRLVELGKIDYNKYDLLLKQSTKARISIADHYFKKNLETDKVLNLTYKSILMANINEAEIPAYSLLAKLGCRFLTTNYDPLFSDALKYHQSQGRPIETSIMREEEVTKSNVSYDSKEDVHICNSIDDFEKSALLNKNILVHLHGSITNEKTLVASTLDYLNLYGDASKIEKLGLLLKDQTVVFIGYGLEELELLDLIVRSSYSSNDKKKFFLLLPLLTHEYEIFDLLEIYYVDQLGIELLPYSRDKSDYHSIVEIIENWSKELPGLVRAPGHSDKIGLLKNLLSEYRGLKNEK